MQWLHPRATALTGALPVLLQFDVGIGGVLVLFLGLKFFKIAP